MPAPGNDDERQARVDDEHYGALYDESAGRYWHFTSWRAVQSIVSGGFIFPNVGQFKASSAYTASSYCYRREVTGPRDEPRYRMSLGRLMTSTCLGELGGSHGTEQS